METQRITRLAPSPTGALHLGNARTFLINWLLARQNNWKIVLRIEDIDGPRIKAGADQQAIDDLRWLGLDWDIGPIYQTHRLPLYAQAVNQLLAAGYAYPCICTRKEVDLAASAPHAEDGAAIYPGTCRARFATAAAAQAAAGRAPAIRFAVPNTDLTFTDSFHGPITINPARQLGDFVIAKADGTPAYQLAVVIDDAEAGVTDVIRGDDLLDSTPRQLLLYQALGIADKTPRYWHLPLVVGEDGRRLAKRHGDTRLSHYRQRGVPATRIIALLARWCGLGNAQHLTPGDLLKHFDVTRLPRQRIIFTAADDSWLQIVLPSCVPTQPGVHMNTQEIIEISGVKLSLPQGLDARISSAMKTGKYEQQEVRALAASLRPDDTVMELGTGIGLVSTYCAQRIGSDRVFTFEANPELEPFINSTYRLNGVRPHLEFCMLSDRHGERDFYIHTAFWESSATSSTQAARVVRISTRPVNERIHQINPTILVIDIEGGEDELVPIIDFHCITRIIIEIHERSMGRQKANAVVRRLYDAGFAINRELSVWEICCLERLECPDRTTHVPLEEFLHGRWRLTNHWTFPFIDDLAMLIPHGSVYALVDEDQWGCLQVLPDRTRLPFTERQGQYWGPPADDAAAIGELERLHDQGMKYIAFGNGATWWLTHYQGLAEHLRSQARCLLQNAQMEVFALR